MKTKEATEPTTSSPSALPTDRVLVSIIKVIDDNWYKIPAKARLKVRDFILKLP